MALKLYSFHKGKTRIAVRKFEVLVEVEIHIVFFWLMAPYSMVPGYLNVFRVNNCCTISHRNVDNTLPKYIKGKGVTLQAWSDPEGSRNLIFPDFMTTAEDGGKVVSLTHRPPLPLVNTPGTHFC